MTLFKSEPISPHSVLREFLRTLLVLAAAAMAAALLASGVARADDALQTLGDMHMTAPVDWPTIPQEGP